MKLFQQIKFATNIDFNKFQPKSFPQAPALTCWIEPVFHRPPNPVPAPITAIGAPCWRFVYRIFLKTMDAKTDGMLLYCNMC